MQTACAVLFYVQQRLQFRKQNVLGKDKMHKKAK